MCMVSMRSAPPHHACRWALPAQGDKANGNDQALAHALDGMACYIALDDVWDLSLATRPSARLRSHTSSRAM